MSRPPVGFEVLLQRHEPLAKRVPFVKPLRLLPAVRVMENGDVFDSKGYYGAPPADPGYADFSTLPWYGNLRSIERARQARAKQAGIDLHKQDVE